MPGRWARSWIELNAWQSEIFTEFPLKDSFKRLDEAISPFKTLPDCGAFRHNSKFDTACMCQNWLKWEGNLLLILRVINFLHVSSQWFCGARQDVGEHSRSRARSSTNLKESRLLYFFCTILHGGMGGTMASWLVHSTLEWVVWVGALAMDIALCCWARHSTLTVPLCPWV